MPKITKEDVMNKLKEVYDMELGYDIVSLGLVYNVEVNDNNDINVKMTLTTPMCPLAGMIQQDAQNKVESLEGANEVNVELTFDPPWKPSMASEEVRNTLGI